MKREAYKEFARRFAETILAHDYSSAHSMLASWLQPSVSPEQLQRLIETELREVAELAELEEMRYPAAYRVDENPLSYEEWREVEERSQEYKGSRRCLPQIPPEMTGENYRKRLVIEFTPGEDEEIDVDAWMDCWVIVVEDGGKLSIGYLEIEDPD